MTFFQFDLRVQLLFLLKQNIFVPYELNTSKKHSPLRQTKLSLFFFCGLLTFMWGCSTTNHATLPTMAYQDITSHYNAYFNSSEKLKNVYKLSLEYHKDKFDSVLPVFHYTDTKEFASYSSDLDDVVKRSTLAIQLHNISNWSDDHFLLIGQANFLKGDYDKAASSFKYITTEFKEGVDYVKVMKGLGKPLKKYVKKKKKKVKPEVKVVINKDGTQTLEKVDKRPQFSLWIHEPARSEALLWLIKTYSRQNKFEEASTVVTYTRGDELFYKNLDPQVDLVEADLRVAEKDYHAAIEPLEKYLGAKKIRKKKKLRVRPLFVLAQCYAVTGNNAKAVENYKKVLKSHPNYDMEFYAKIKMAKLGRGDGGMDIRKLLAKMAKDNKYRDYFDQIYYELALISIAENSRAEARNFLHKSIDNSTSNDEQKALSFLKLAELDYQDEDYVSSKFFYDSTMSFMSKNDVRYADIAERAKVLDNLVKQLTTIATEDSLQKLAGMSEVQREKIIRDAVFKKEQEEEEKKAAAASGSNSQLNNFMNNQQQQNAQQQNAQQGSSWYFYNVNARSTGYNDFVKKWGRRKLEENWRRKNKSSAISDDDNAVASDTTVSTQKDSAIAINSGSMEDQMHSSIPLTPEKLDKSNGKLIDAYYTAGTIYKDGLESYAKADNMFETLNARFPKNKLLLESYYNLYLIALKQKNSTKAEEYKNKILAEFPESVIAKVLRDPNFVNEAKQKEKAVFDYYERAYNDYSVDSLDSCWYKCEMADKLFKPNPISGKFQLLEALVLSKQNRLADYVQALNKIISKATDVEVKKTATDLLAALNKSSLPQIDLSKDSTKRDSLNAVFFRGADTSEAATQKQLNEAKEKAKQGGAVVKTDTTTKQVVTSSTDTTTRNTSLAKDTSARASNVAQNVVEEDTTSPYVRSDAAVHYFIIYIKDATTPQSAIMSTMAKVDAFNSTQFTDKRLVAKQVLIDSKNKLINIRQFMNREDVMSYYKVIKSQDQLFSDLKKEQYAITCISTINFSTLLSEKNVDLYNEKFFKRVYK